MTFFEKDQASLIDFARIDAPRFGNGSSGRHREQKRIVEQADGLDLGVGQRQRQHHRVEVAASEFFEQNFGLGFAQFDDQVRDNAPAMPEALWAAGRARASE